MTTPDNPARRPKIALAFSGGTLRAISQVGILEVLDENQIPIDYIAAASSGCIAAASYACGTLQELKKAWFNLTADKLKSLIDREGSNGGIYHLRKFEDYLRQFTLNKHFEDVTPRLAFVAVDILRGEEVALQMGDLARGARISCSVPGIFEPVRWGNRLLVDGGLLLDTVPVDVATQMGADLIIGVDIADSKYVFGNYGWLIFFWKKYLGLRNSEPGKFFVRLKNALKNQIAGLLPDNSDWPDADDARHSWFGVLSRSLDVMVEKKYRTEVRESRGQILLQPKIKHLRSYDPRIVSVFYKEGRRAATEALPRIKKLILDYGRA